MASIDGSSYPSVSTAQFATTVVSPLFRCSRMPLRSSTGVAPDSASAAIPSSHMASATA